MASLKNAALGLEIPGISILAIKAVSEIPGALQTTIIKFEPNLLR